MLPKVLPKDIVEIIESGKKPLVRFTLRLWDESFGNKGMIARIESAIFKPHGLISIQFNYNEFREHNLNLDQPNWWIGSTNTLGTAIEANHFTDPKNLIENIVFDPRDNVGIEFVEENNLLSEYIKEKENKTTSLDYISWLEKKIGDMENEIHDHFDDF